MNSLFILVAAVGIGVGCHVAPQPASARVVTQQSQIAVGRQRIEAFIKAFNEGTPEPIKKMLEENFVLDAPGVPSIDQRVQRLIGLSKEKGPFQFKEIVDESEKGAIAVIKDGEGMEVGLLFEWDPKKAFKIVGVRIGEPKALKAELAGVPSLEGWKSLSELADVILEKQKAPAIAVAVVKDGKLEQAVRGTREIGKADPAATEDRWIVGSIGKSFTGTLAAMLVDKGLIKWSTTVGEALNDIPMKDGYKNVTLLQLLQHRGGVPQDPGMMMPQIVRIAGNATEPRALRENYAKDILGRDLIAAPGTSMNYSNAGYALASVMLERVTKMPFEEAMAQYVFKPLGLKSAIYAPVGAPGAPGSDGQPKGHRVNGDKLTPLRRQEPRLGLFFAGAGGGLSMSIGDLARYAEYHLNGLRGKVTLMSKENFDQMHTPAAGGGERYGTGWGINSDIIPGVTVHGHNGGEGSFHADMGLFPDKNMAVVAVANMGNDTMPPSLIAMVNAYKGYAR